MYVREGFTYTPRVPKVTDGDQISSLTLARTAEAFCVFLLLNLPCLIAQLPKDLGTVS
jgi:hypothetical protein